MPNQPLTEEEINWIQQGRLTRLTDNEPALIAPMGAERYLALQLFEDHAKRFALRKTIAGKNLVIVPGYANNAFLFAQAGAKSVTVYDKDPVTIAFIKAIKNYYYFQEAKKPNIGELVSALTDWYPPLLAAPKSKINNLPSLLFYPIGLRKKYFIYLLSLLKKAVLTKSPSQYMLNQDITCFKGEALKLLKANINCDVLYIPYLLGVKHGIEAEGEIVKFITKFLHLNPKSQIIITPIKKAKEFGLVGKRYFNALPYNSLSQIPALKSYLQYEDNAWFGSQGLCVLGNDIL
ncbi:MAG: hypothetical protein A3F18_03205 [Legionellales bacterium RIFCSPHIGHO2_12_FULL_37_14]|nr:MAG: hypothetical protein A3F18_03205 [Legionellales bacterium RIFCSPHIGHO2_12_FULL_37_14]